MAITPTPTPETQDSIEAGITRLTENLDFVQKLAQDVQMGPVEFYNMVQQACKAGGTRVMTKDEMAQFLTVANDYKLDPRIGQIYAFAKTAGGIQIIVSIDGWLAVLHRHDDVAWFKVEPDFNEQGDLVSCTATIKRKSWENPMVIAEYYRECKRETSPWKQWPIRMLRHKALIQCARYALGMTDFIDHDEGERQAVEGVLQMVNTDPPKKKTKPKPPPKPSNVEKPAKETRPEPPKTEGPPTSEPPAPKEPTKEKSATAAQKATLVSTWIDLTDLDREEATEDPSSLIWFLIDQGHELKTLPFKLAVKLLADWTEKGDYTLIHEFMAKHHPKVSYPIQHDILDEEPAEEAPPEATPPADLKETPAPEPPTDKELWPFEAGEENVGHVESFVRTEIKKLGYPDAAPSNYAKSAWGLTTDKLTIEGWKAMWTDLVVAQ